MLAAERTHGIYVACLVFMLDMSHKDSCVPTGQPKPYPAHDIDEINYP